MTNALISPAVGTVMMAVSTAAAVRSVKKVSEEGLGENKIPLMGVAGAMVFAAQMVNYPIPVAGSSGHFVGGLFLSILLGPHAAFLTILSILSVQAMFFADGGLLALGCNIFNMGFLACFVAYPLIYKPVEKRFCKSGKFLGALLASVAALELGAFAVATQTLLSGRVELPFGAFLSAMMPVYLPIGIGEGIITAAVVALLSKVSNKAEGAQTGSGSRRILAYLGTLAAITGIFFSWFASSSPDGLEWSVFQIVGNTEISQTSTLGEALSDLQSRISFLPYYGFKFTENTTSILSYVGTSLSIAAGEILTIALTYAFGFMAKRSGGRQSIR